MKQTYEENKRWLEISLWGRAGQEASIPIFPFTLVSQFWSMIDRFAVFKGAGIYPAA